MSNTIKDNQDPKSLEREANARRESLSRTLDAVEQRLSPNHLSQQAASYFGEHGGDIAKSVSRSVKENPLPLLLTGIGLAWLISTQSRSSSSSYGDSGYGGRSSDWDERDYISDRTRSAYAQNALSVADGRSSHKGGSFGHDSDDRSMIDNAKQTLGDWSQTASQWRDELQEKLKSIKQEAGESAEQWQERVVDASVDQAEGLDKHYRQARDSLLSRHGERTDLVGSAKQTLDDWAESAGQWRDQLQGKLKSIKQEAGETTEQWQDRIVNASVEQAEGLDHQYRQAKNMMMARGRQHAQSTKNFMQEQPLVAGALGVAVGALIGALLPTSKVEDELIGDKADIAKSAIAQRAESVGNQVASTVTDNAQTLRETGEEQLDQVKSKSTHTEPV